jgi:putative flippase GtrA
MIAAGCGNLLKFGCVGVLATLTHLGVVALLVTAGIHPLYANIFAFITAFNVSYLGHRYWTFNKNSSPHVTAITRFLGVAILSFLLNEFLFFLFLKFTALPYLLAIFIVLLIVTPTTFLLSRMWAFR